MHPPLRVRLVVAFAAGMAVVLAALGAFLYVRVGQDLLNAIDMDLRSRAQVIAGGLRGRGADLVRSEGKLIDPDEAFSQVLAQPDRVVDSSSAVSGAPMLDSAQARSVAGPTFFTTRVHGVDDPARLLAVPVRRGSERLYVVVGATLGDRNEAMGRLLLELAIGGPVALGLVAGAGWMLAGAALRPVERMRREADALSLSEPSRRLPVPSTGDELTRLATTLNAMLDRVQEAMERERRFLDEASHELRTPLGVLRMELDLALARDRTPREMEAALRNAAGETDRLVRLAEHLLVLSRSVGGRLPLHRRETSMCELLERAASATEAKASGAGIDVVVQCDDGVAVVIDPERVRQAVDDLLDNALRHSSPGGTVALSAVRGERLVQVTVRDDGPGFPPHVLDGAGGLAPDASERAAAAGLGLAIVGAIANAHGGTLRLRNPEGGGAQATLEFPVR